MTDLLREAIADAKAVREVALENAKLALQEAFTPRIQSMISTKLAEEAEGYEDETMEEEEEMKHDSEMEEGWNEGEEHSEDMGMQEGGYGDEEVEEAFVFEEDDEEEMPEAPAETEDMGGEEEMDFSMEDEEEPMDEDLMEIIRQLEEELHSSEIGKTDNKQPSKSASDDHTQQKKEPLIQLVEEEEEEEMNEMDSADEDDVDIQEIINALREEGEMEDEDEMHEAEEPEMEEGSHESEEKLQEAYAVIQFLREKLNEVNLLNSKLLFSNKLFRSHSLTESQKMTVIENFDRAGSLREVKLVYATLAESLRAQSVKKPRAPKASLKESFNRIASKPQASTRPSKKILTESNEVTDRFKKLAGLI